jgi:hypothetical protein
MPLLATGSGDGTARIWRIAPGSVSAKTSKELALNPVVLKHAQGAKEKGKDVTTLDWNVRRSFHYVSQYPLQPSRNTSLNNNVSLAYCSQPELSLRRAHMMARREFGTPRVT